MICLRTLSFNLLIVVSQDQAMPWYIFLIRIASRVDRMSVYMELVPRT